MKLKSMLLGALALGCACAFGGENKESAAAQKLQTCDFLLNKDFKKDAKYYLCLFSASWCGPCRREMPRIAKTYAEQLKSDPDIELIHFSRDQNDEKALVWAKEHDVKFPVVKPQGGNPLDLHSRGIPHIFIVKADGTLLSEGHPMKLFTDENLRLLKAGTFTKPETATEKTRKAIAKLFPGWSLDTELAPNGNGQNYQGLHHMHRGRANVLSVHPNWQQNNAPVILSHTVRLSEKKPCLFLGVSTWNEEADFLLSVLVNGKEALPARLICTPDFEPWQDIGVSLAEWRGSEVKIEVVVKVVNRCWYENCFLSRLEIAEGKGDMRITEGTEKVGGYTWSYRAQNGEATIIAEKDGKFSRAVSPCPVGQLTIPATLGGAKVTRIGRSAFEDCSGITSVMIPEVVTRIGRGAFLNCTGLSEVKIPASVKVLEWDAFGNCTGLASVIIPDGLENIDRAAFYFCYGLRSIAIPSSVRHIGQSAFWKCSTLISVVIPSGVTDVKLCTFRGCNALTSMIIPASVTNIHHTAFCDTGALTSFRVEEGNRFYKSENGLLLTKDGKTLVRGVNGEVKIPSSVTTIGPCAFEGCVSLRPIAIPDGVKSIGDYAFKQCRNMTSVTIPEGVTSIGRETFAWCSSLKSVTIPQGVTSTGFNAFCDCRELESVTLPSTMKSIGEATFARTKLSSVTIPKGVTRIGKNAFSRCGILTSITIPSSVQRIDEGAFFRCEALTSLTIPSTVANIDRTAFDRCSKLKSINVVTDGKIEGVSLAEFFKRRDAERTEQLRELKRIQEELKRTREERALGQQRVPTRPGLTRLGASLGAAQRQRKVEMEEQRRQLQEIQAQLKALKAEQDRMKAEKSSGK